MMNKKHFNLLQIIASAAVFVGVVLKFSNIEVAKYLFASGVFGLFILQILYAYQTRKKAIKRKRIVSLMFIATIILGLGAYFMYIGNDNWVLAVLIYALVSLFLSFRDKR